MVRISNENISFQRENTQSRDKNSKNNKNLLKLMLFININVKNMKMGTLQKDLPKTIKLPSGITKYFMIMVPTKISLKH
jgi:hypothetical protein